MEDAVENRIKIFVACHKDCTLPDNKIFVPVCAGAALNGNIKGMVADDSGDNISSKNPGYCELTVMYWAWKNVDLDYYGFCHYRRYFCFNNKKYKANEFAEIVEKYYSQKLAEEYGLSSENNIAEFLNGYDLVIPEKGGFGGVSLYDQYAQSHYKSDLDFVIEIIRRDYPYMANYADKYIHGKEGYFCNMFVMKRELFNEYCNWLFTILEEHERCVDISRRGVNGKRVYGFLAERLCGIFIDYILKTRKLKTLSLSRVLFENIDKQEEFKPAFKENNIAVSFASDNNFVAYLSVALNSFKDMSSKEYNYDIIVLTTDITENNKIALKNLVECENISLRFLNVERYMQKYANLPVRAHFKVQTYYRLLLADILTSYDKILYLDTDVVICADVAKLYNTDVEGMLCAACRDADTAGLYNGYFPDKKDYMDNILKIKDPYSYFQAGVILFNLGEIRKSLDSEKIMQFAQYRPWQLLDQDVLNYFMQGRVKYVDMSWNVLTDWKDKRIKEIIALAPHDMYNEYMEARRCPKIIHYAGPDKPWDNPDSDFASIFWKYARQSPFYEEIVSLMMSRANNK